MINKPGQKETQKKNSISFDFEAISRQFDISTEFDEKIRCIICCHIHIDIFSLTNNINASPFQGSAQSPNKKIPLSFVCFVSFFVHSPPHSYLLISIKNTAHVCISILISKQKPKIVFVHCALGGNNAKGETPRIYNIHAIKIYKKDFLFVYSSLCTPPLCTYI